MVGIRVIAVTHDGYLAMERHLSELKRMGLREKIVGRSMFAHEVVNKNPLTIEITCKSPQLARLLVPENLRKPAIDAMKVNGAVLGKDYTLVDL